MVDLVAWDGDDMGLRFDLGMANWVAFVTDERSQIPDFSSPMIQSGPHATALAIAEFLHYIRRRLMSSNWGEREFGSRVDELLHRAERGAPLTPDDLNLVRDYFRPRDWTALILPSGAPDSRLDEFLCSEALLRILVNAGSTDRGLLLQLVVPPRAEFSLTDVFPAFALALEHRSEWPALLVWNNRSEAELFPLGDDQPQALESLSWILGHVGGVPLNNVQRDYYRRFGLRENRPVTIIQLSDIHLGSEEANIRLPLLQQHLAQLVNRHRKSSDVVLAVTGDLMDSPDNQHLDRVRAFIQFVGTLELPPAIYLIGNHDVRRNGFLNEQLRAMLQLPIGAASGVRWFDAFGIGVVAVNSVVRDHLASGFVGERQLIDLAVQLDQKANRFEYTLISAIHHHPTPVARPDWYVAPFYERLIGSAFEETESLDDAGAFLQFIRDQGVSAILHGHKHIPRIGKVPGTEIPIIGCGSSVGKVPTADRAPYLSVNVVTIDRAKQQVVARLLASRAAGGRLTERGNHQAVLMSPLLPG
jgi:hypothetical protein